jgi:hypothetical protein
MMWRALFPSGRNAFIATVLILTKNRVVVKQNGGKNGMTELSGGKIRNAAQSPKEWFKKML